MTEHPEGKPFSLSTYNRHKCRCDRCSGAAAMERAQRLARGLPDHDARHGTSNGYNRYGCRCERCTAFGIDQQAAKSEARRARTGTTGKRECALEGCSEFVLRHEKCATHRERKRSARPNAPAKPTATPKPKVPPKPKAAPKPKVHAAKPRFESTADSRARIAANRAVWTGDVIREQSVSSLRIAVDQGATTQLDIALFRLATHSARMDDTHERALRIIRYERVRAALREGDAA